MKRISIVLGVILLVFAGLWYFVLRNNYNLRFPDGWVWTVDTVGYSSFAVDGAWPEGTTVLDDPISISAREVTASTANAPAGLVHIHDHYETYDPTTGAPTWSLDLDADVDPKTGQYTEGD